MLCTRCHAREARVLSPESRARFEKALDTPWPLRDDVCEQCFRDRLKEDPQLRARFRELSEKVQAKAFAKIGADVRRVVNSALDSADRIADRLRDALK